MKTSLYSTSSWKRQGVAMLGIAAMLTLCGQSLVYAQLSASDIAAMKQEIAKQKYTFTVDENPATKIPLSQLCGTIPSLAPKSANSLSSKTMVAETALPSYWDWRQHNGVTPVKDQGNCGSCWAFSTVGTMEAMILIASGTTTDLSEQQLVSCNPYGWSCNGGNYAFDMEISPGAMLESCFPYQAADVACQSGCPYVYQLSSWGYVGDSSSVPSTAAIKNAIYTYGPISVEVAVDYYFQAYSGGVFNDNTDSSIDHAVVLVGWDDSNGCWIMKNSWGTGWGESGYMRIAYGCDQIGYAAAYAVWGMPGPPLSITCPSNITVTTCDTNGVVVNYPAPMVSGVCPPYTTNCVPPSGSLFPMGTTTVNCCATDSCGQSNCCSFTVTVSPPVPVITAFSPASGVVGAGVTISGTNFSPIASNNIVYFGAVRAVVTVASVTNLTVTVPVSATYAPITETVNGLTAYANQPFMPTFSGDGSGISTSSFAPRLDLAADNSSAQAVIADMDGDGKPDLIILNGSLNGNSPSVSIFRNISTNGSLTANSFAPRVDLSLGVTTLAGGDMTVADLDGDGRLDIVVASFDPSKVSIFQNFCSPGSITSNSFGARVDIPVNGGSYQVAVRDLDGDGKPDIVTVNMVDWSTDTNNHVSVLRNISTVGNITFASTVNFPGVPTSCNLAIGDLDGDGKLDLVVSSFNYGQAVSVYRNVSTPGSITTNSFAPHVDFAVGGWGNDVAIGDLDGDGKPDLAVVTQLPDHLSLFKNTSMPGSFTINSFAPRVDFTADYNPNGVAIGDLDGDGRPDIVFANTYDNTISIYQNVTPFEGPPIITTQPANQTVTVGSTVNFSVTATGSSSLFYQWRFNGTDISWATNATLTLTNVQFNQAGNYAVLVTNLLGSILSSNALLTVLPPLLVQNGGFELGTFDYWTTSGNFDYCSVNSDNVHSGVYSAKLGPVGTLGYISQTLATTAGQRYLVSCWLYCDGETPNEFSVSWNGTTLFDRQNIGATLWTNLQFVVSATTTNTVLTFGFQDDPSYLYLDDIAVYQMPTINSQPTNQMVMVGGTAAFSVVASGTPPLSYQWNFNGTNLVGATNTTLILTNVQLSQAANYTIIITNTWGSVTSSVATLTVAPSPIIYQIICNADGSVTLNLLTAPNISSRVLAATNLAPPVVWQPIYTNVAGANGAWQFTDMNASNYPVRFYRSFTP